MALIKCKECGAMISDKAGHCPHCGAPVEIQATVCKECGEPHPKGAVTCPHCGAPLKMVHHMGFQESVSTCFRKYATFTGRARRAEYWYFNLFQLLFGLLIYFLLRFVPYNTIGAIVIIANIFLFIPWLAVSARRLHDIGKSGWYIVSLMIIPSIGVLFTNLSTMMYLWLFFFIWALLGLIQLLLWSIKKSSEGDNQYGPSPLYKDID